MLSTRSGQRDTWSGAWVSKVNALGYFLYIESLLKDLISYHILKYEFSQG